MILSNNGTVLQNGNMLSSNFSHFTFISSGRSFPMPSNSITGIGGVIFLFSEPTTVLVDWGNNTTSSFNTELRDGQHIFDIRRQGVASGAGTVPTETHVSSGIDYGFAADRAVKIIFPKNLVISIFLSNLFSSTQPIRIPLYLYKNLKILRISENKQEIGSNPFLNGLIKDIDFNYIDQSNIEEFTFVSSADDAETISWKIPNAVFDLPLRKLEVSLKQTDTKTFDDSNLNLIGERLSETLEELRIVAQLTDTKGISETPADPAYPNTGGLPGNFLKLTNLKSLSFNNYRNQLVWRTIPPVISQMFWLERLNFSYSYLSSTGPYAFTIPSTFFSNMTSLSFLGLNNLVRNIGDYDFILNLPITIQEIQLQSNSNQTNLDNSIFACFNLVKNKSLNDLVLMFQTFTAVTAKIPSGTYQEPTDHDNPASPLEAIWVMRNEHDCTIIYYE